jgi:hypothetical protein
MKRTIGRSLGGALLVAALLAGCGKATNDDEVNNTPSDTAAASAPATGDAAPASGASQ